MTLVAVMDKKEIGQRIRTAREQRQWTQDDLARAVGAGRRTVDNWENGRTSPKNRTSAIEQALDIALRDSTILGPVAGHPPVAADPTPVAPVSNNEILAAIARMDMNIASMNARLDQVAAEVAELRGQDADP